MTRTEPRLSGDELQALLSKIIAELGAWRVLKAAVKQLFRRKPISAHELGFLSDHLRRDIGLKQQPPPLPSQRNRLY